jgi:predicted tellurium resistance membrane protein TerC
LEQLLTLLRLGVSTTLLDVDNALYMTATVDPLSPEEQKRAIRWGLFIEFLARLGLVVVFGYLASGTEVLFEVFGISFTVETLSLLAAGLFLILEMSLVNALLSVDTVIALTGSAIGSGAQFWLVIFLLLFSAVVRLLFVQEIARFIQRYPATNIIILMFLIVIGLELTAQGLGARIPEILFNGLMLLALLVAVLYQLRYGRPAQARR